MNLKLLFRIYAGVQTVFVLGGILYQNESAG